VMRATLIVIAVCLLAACGPQATDAPGADVELLETEWQWQAFEDAADGQEARDIRVPDPTRYTVTLRSDGAAEIRADCNRLRWTYTLEAGGLTFDTLGPSTLAYCGDDSLDGPFLTRLGATASYVLADGRLHLNLKLDSGNLVFAAAN